MATTEKKQIKYYCSKAVNDTCKTGFSTLSGYTRHKMIVHAAIPKQLNKPPSQKSGAYFMRHPIVNGMFKQSSIIVIKFLVIIGSLQVLFVTQINIHPHQIPSHLGHHLKVELNLN
jgi:hypothetical protein